MKPENNKFNYHYTLLLSGHYYRAYVCVHLCASNDSSIHMPKWT